MGSRGVKRCPPYPMLVHKGKRGWASGMMHAMETPIPSGCFQAGLFLQIKSALVQSPPIQLVQIVPSQGWELCKPWGSPSDTARPGWELGKG